MAASSSITASQEFQNAFTYTARRHFNVEVCHWQAKLGGYIMQKHFDRKKCRMLCIQGTGKGKSLLYQTLAAHFVGVTVYISPLLTLSADQVGKLMARTHVLGSIP